MNSKLIRPDEVVVLKPIEPLTKHPHSPEISYTQLMTNLRNIQRQSPQIVFPFLLNQYIVGRRHGAKHNKSPSFKVKCNTPCQWIRRNPSNHLYQSLNSRVIIPTASFRCPLANRFARLFLPISLAFRFTMIPVIIAPLPTRTTVTRILFLPTI